MQLQYHNEKTEHKYVSTKKIMQLLWATCDHSFQLSGQRNKNKHASSKNKQKDKKQQLPYFYLKFLTLSYMTG